MSVMSLDSRDIISYTSISLGLFGMGHSSSFQFFVLNHLIDFIKLATSVYSWMR